MARETIKARPDMVGAWRLLTVSAAHLGELDEARRALAETKRLQPTISLAWARERETFGRRLADHQVIRHKLVEMDRRIRAGEAWNQLLVPAGFAHGFMTLERDCEGLYKVSGPYSKEAEGAIRWDDPDLAIDWPTDLCGEPLLSDKDAAAPLLADAEVYS